MEFLEHFQPFLVDNGVQIVKKHGISVIKPFTLTFHTFILRNIATFQPWEIISILGQRFSSLGRDQTSRCHLQNFSELFHGGYLSTPKVLLSSHENENISKTNQKETLFYYYVLYIALVMTSVNLNLFSISSVC